MKPVSLDLALIWHMHQPDYRDRSQRKMLLPWVRLHALKDYYDMPMRLAKYEGVHQTFNLVPSLIEQMECCLQEGWREDELDLFLARAEDLSEEQKHRILASFFLSPENRMIRPYPRYGSLLRDSRLRSPSDLIHRWTAQEWRDLQFWRQLVWFDPLIRESDPFILDLFHQGQNFDEIQKETLLARMKHWVAQALLAYKTMQDQGRIEVSVTPYYHPILPLLIDPATCHEAMPNCPLPDPHGCHPEDARAQVEKAIACYEKHFGQRPLGMWPSEGSVSQATAQLMADCGIRWIATDEEILARSLGCQLRESSETRAASHALYRPYTTLSGKGPDILFRDHRLSDLIGFQYANWDPEDAAGHLIKELLFIAENWTESEPPLVSIILDGENCWEYYDKDGGPFLDALYSKLEDHPAIHSLTASEAIAKHASAPLERLSAGSWINGDFFIWMGEEPDRRAWALLEETRRALSDPGLSKTVSADRLADAWEELYVAQGSDWFWWFGDTHRSKQDALFDEMFRLHLLRVYEIIGKPAPASLRNPVETPLVEHFATVEPYLNSPPIIDGMETHYYEWRAAARYEPSRQGGTMAQSAKSRLLAIAYGVDDDCFYLRIDPSRQVVGQRSAWKYELRVTAPKPMRFRFVHAGSDHEVLRNDNGAASDSTGKESQWSQLADCKVLFSDRHVFEAAIPWEVLETAPGEVLSFCIGAPAGKNDIELAPPLSSLCVTVPGENRPGRHWFP